MRWWKDRRREIKGVSELKENGGKGERKSRAYPLTPGLGLDKKLANIEAGNNLGRRLDAGFIFQWSSTLIHILLEKCGFMQNAKCTGM